eukprot:scaffold244091_cov18-Tisochrysis_lutea.AAC.1
MGVSMRTDFRSGKLLRLGRQPGGGTTYSESTSAMKLVLTQAEYASWMHWPSENGRSRGFVTKRPDSAREPHENWLKYLR